MFRPLQRAKNRFRPDYVLVVECRRCGTPAERGADSCTACESESIARYEIR